VVGSWICARVLRSLLVGDGYCKHLFILRSCRGTGCSRHSGRMPPCCTIGARRPGRGA
jgi:hypothetical protein